MDNSMRRVALLSLHSSPIAAPGRRPDVGGMNLYVRRLADGLANLGIEVDVFTRRTDPQSPEIVHVDSGARLIHLAAGPARRLPKSVLPMHINSMVASFEGFMERERLSYDVLHSHYWISGLVAMRHRVRLGASVPFITMFHTLARLKSHYSGEADRSDSALRIDGERCLIGRADVVVGATEAEHHDMARLYGRQPAAYATIPPGVDFELFRPVDRAFSRRILGIEADRVIVFVGRQDPLKGLGILVHSIAELPVHLRTGMKVIIIGGGDGPGGRPGRKLATFVGRLGLQDIVRMEGHVEQYRLPLYYSAADICAVPSAYESFGMAAVEAMACGTPVVAFRVGGLATTVRDGVTGFLAPSTDGKAYAETLRGALEHPERSVLGCRARLSVQRYSWAAVTARTAELYEEAAEQYGRGRRLSVV